MSMMIIYHHSSSTKKNVNECEEDANEERVEKEWTLTIIVQEKSIIHVWLTLKEKVQSRMKTKVRIQLTAAVPILEAINPTW